ncbi:hypothetical protein [Paraburkholderia rhynchosiae]|uniref:Uncharacterized protein n=1 Tax=Paraburkholderia rhynchosiae TaxID=487049 RepID=A0A2N7WMC5_9BURK|nr:hypothetical protein [Paraburkholderia rhynchosiae]PMS30598.1 hypothetical protein C0Z16_13625 [Paraburkholderia rhynchosiae]CAB3684556.1 hypothetical protein LMG27174_02832 [Paraburkholderia rhynchosiae]
MSSRHDRNREFEAGLRDLATPEWNNPAPGTDAQTMHGLHVASQNVLRLATQTYNAAARGDEAAAQAARASLEKQLGLTTRLIDELLSGGADQPTMH